MVHDAPSGPEGAIGVGLHVVGRECVVDLAFVTAELAGVCSGVGSLMEAILAGRVSPPAATARTEIIIALATLAKLVFESKGYIAGSQTLQMNV